MEAPLAVTAPAEARKLLLNFVLMSVCFSLNHGTVSAVIALSTALLGTGLGSVNLGTLWLMYVITAMVFATAIIGAVGPKGGLLLGTLGYCLYVLSFLVAAWAAPSDVGWPSADPSEQAASCAAVRALNTTTMQHQACEYSPGNPAICECPRCPAGFVRLSPRSLPELRA